MELAPTAETNPRPAASGLPVASVLAAMGFGTVVFLGISTAPIILGGLVHAGRLTNEGLGVVATLELVGIAVGAFAGAGGGLMRERMAMKSLACCLILAALNWACMGGEGGASIGALRAGCGLLEGLILGAANLILTYSRNPEAMSGYFLGVTTLPQVLAAYFLTGYAVPKFGPAIGFQLMAIASILAAAGALFASSAHIPRPNTERVAARRWSALGLAALFAVVLQNAAVGACFAYIVQLSAQNRVPEAVTGGALAGLQIAAMIGSLLVGVAAHRFSQAIVLTLGCLLQVAVTLAFLYWGAPIGFVVCSAVFGLCWNGLLPFALKLIIKIDPSRHLALFNTPASLTGLAVGPFLASGLVGAHDVAPAFGLAAGLFAAGAGLFTVINLTLARAPAHG